MSNAMLTAPCLDCGRMGRRHQARGLCPACYQRRWDRGSAFADRPRVGTRHHRCLPAPGEPLERYLAAADATLRAEIRARLADGRSLVMAGDWLARIAFQPDVIAAD